MVEFNSTHVRIHTEPQSRRRWLDPRTRAALDAAVLSVFDGEAFGVVANRTLEHAFVVVRLIGLNPCQHHFRAVSDAMQRETATRCNNRSKR